MIKIGTKQAAKILGVNDSRIRQLIIAKKLRAVKFGRDWMLNATDVNQFKEFKYKQKLRQ